MEDDLRTYERKYNMLSEIFFEGYANGEEPPDDNWGMDWTAWASVYKIRARLREQYRAAIFQLRIETPAIADIIARTARRESILVLAGMVAMLISTAPHHKHFPPDIKHHRIPVLGLSFTPLISPS